MISLITRRTHGLFLKINIKKKKNDYLFFTLDMAYNARAILLRSNHKIGLAKLMEVTKFLFLVVSYLGFLM